MRFESYAQEWEDLILYIILKNIRGGVLHRYRCQ
jgi:hypothetical protein